MNQQVQNYKTCLNNSVSSKTKYNFIALRFGTYATIGLYAEGYKSYSPSSEVFYGTKNHAFLQKNRLDENISPSLSNY